MEMSQISISSGLGNVDSYTESKDVEKPSDGFGEGEYSHFVQLHGDSAVVDAAINCLLYL